MLPFKPDYSAFRLMTEPAKDNAEVWRLGLGIISIIVSFVVMSTGLSVLLFQFWTHGDQAIDLASTVVSGSTPAGVLIAMGSIGILSVSAYLVTEFIHNRSGLTLFGPVSLATTQARQVLPGLFAILAIALVLTLIVLPGPLLPNLTMARWLVLLPLTIAVLLLQTASEEILFRGYLQSQLGGMTSNPMIWMLLPSVVFASLHWAPGTFGENAIWPVLFAGLMGLLAADLTARSGTLGPAIALHFVNNFGAIALVAPQEELSGLALWTFPFGPSDEAAMLALLPMDMIMIIAFWLVCRVAMRR